MLANCEQCSRQTDLRKDTFDRTVHTHGKYLCGSCARKGMLFGVGINDADYITSKCKYYVKWVSMLRRCYKDCTTAYVGVTVCNEWSKFSNFKAWMETQKWEGLQLDKDIIKLGNKVYSPETCCFVSGALNTAIQSTAKGYVKRGNTYTARIKNYGIDVSLGTYQTVGDATDAYRLAKVGYLKGFIAELNDERVIQGLQNHIKELENV